MWGRIRKIIERENVPAPVAGMFYQAVVAAVLLYGSESWVLPAAQLARLEGFHVECARRLTGMRPHKRGDRWVYPKSADVLRAARLQPLEYYIHKRRATVAKTISTRPILEECRGAARRRGTPVRSMWWELDLTQPPEPDRGGDGTPGLRECLGTAPREGRSFQPGHPHYQPPRASATTAEEQLAAWRAEWEARDPAAEAELARRMAEAYLP